MAREMDRYIQTGVHRIEKVEWLEAFVAACALALNKWNILSG
jgi:tellurite resistance protein